MGARPGTRAPCTRSRAVNAAANAAELYSHLRTVIAVGLSLSLARLLTGLAQFVQHPRRRPVYGVHLAWAAFMILEVLQFWWFEFGLGLVQVWTFERFVFVVAFASVHFIISPPCSFPTISGNTGPSASTSMPGGAGSSPCSSCSSSATRPTRS